ncbi:MAG: hypothetical protein ACXWMN_08310, partial [Candidatus Limnocylindria bacterium]
MSFRNRPVLDRKHRPRWQDELRTQQLIVTGFAVAIAVAMGIFAATAWSDHYDTHLRPVAAVGDVTYTIDDLSDRMDAISSELQARYFDLQGRTDTIASELQAQYDDLTSQLGGSRDSFIQQVQQSIQQAAQSLASSA